MYTCVFSIAVQEVPVTMNDNGYVVLINVRGYLKIRQIYLYKAGYNYHSSIGRSKQLLLHIYHTKVH